MSRVEFCLLTPVANPNSEPTARLTGEAQLEKPAKPVARDPSVVTPVTLAQFLTTVWDETAISVVTSVVIQLSLSDNWFGVGISSVVVVGSRGGASVLPCVDGAGFPRLRPQRPEDQRTRGPEAQRPRGLRPEAQSPEARARCPSLPSDSNSPRRV